MAEPNIVLTRIDNRLIHGQVATQWCQAIDANLIIVANDEVSTNKMRQGIMDMAAPEGMATRYFSIDKTIDVIHKADPSQRIFIIVETPADALALVEGGVPITKINVGNMHLTQDKHQVATSVAVGDADIAAFKALRDKGVELEVRRVPSTPAEDVDKLFS